MQPPHPTAHPGSLATTMTATAPILTATGLEKRYGRGEVAVDAIDGIDLQLHAGELVAVMGASGSGKTTLLHVLAGLARPDRGSVSFVGRELATMSDKALTRLRRTEMGFVFQAYNLMPTLNARDNTALPLLLAGRRPAEARAAAERALDAVSMLPRAGHLPNQLSGGEQQRVAVARALVGDPKLVLADEPTGNLDRRNRDQVCELLAEVATADSRAVLLVTHEPSVAARASRVVVLCDGRVTDDFERSDVADPEQLAARCQQS